MKLYAGIDLHGNNSVVTVLDDQDRTVYAKRLPNDLDAIVASLRACAGTVEQAFSDDGGRIWEVNWINRYTQVVE